MTNFDLIDKISGVAPLKYKQDELEKEISELEAIIKMKEKSKQDIIEKVAELEKIGLTEKQILFVMNKDAWYDYYEILE